MYRNPPPPSPISIGGPLFFGNTHEKSDFAAASENLARHRSENNFVKLSKQLGRKHDEQGCIKFWHSSNHWEF